MMCPCGRRTVYIKKRIIINGVDCGILKVEVCKSCKSEYFSNEVVKYVQDKVNKIKPRNYKMSYLDK